MPLNAPSVLASSREPGQGLRRLEAVMAVLRGPGGCPWDREQSLTSLKPYLVEEVYELLEAIDANDPERHLEELGDVLLQVVFQSQIRKEQGAFAIDDVAHGIAEKLVRRHPHVFGDVTVEGTADVVRNWEAIKRREGRKPDEAARSPLAGVPASLPALLRAQRVQSKCAKAGCDWSALHEVRAKVAEETAALEAALAGNAPWTAHAELGDLLFAIANLARSLDIDAEDALRTATDRFAARFEGVAAEARADGVELHNLTIQELMARWQTVKAREPRQPEPGPPASRSTFL